MRARWMAVLSIAGFLLTGPAVGRAWAQSPPFDYFSVTPCRVLDTRVQGQGPALTSGVSRIVTVTGGSCGIPASARAIAANVTAVGSTGLGNIRLYPGDGTVPPTSALNFGAGQTRANNGVFPLAGNGDGTLAIRAIVAGGGTVDVVLDVTGYFAEPACVASACPGVDTECQTRACINGACGFTFQPAGTVIAIQTAGDCRQNQCDGAGSIQSVVNNGDVPNDGQQCTGDVCTAGTPSNPPEPIGTACNQGGGLVCDGAGSCVACLAASDCPGSDTECQNRTCTNGACGMNFQPVGTVTASQTAGDCHQNECDGSGSIQAVVNDNDVPNDGQQCTGDVCTAGTPSNPPEPIGTACNQGGGLVCDGAGNCVP